MLRSVLATALLVAARANAHFTVQYPTTVGAFKDDDEDKDPCGGYSPDIATIETVDFHVGGDAVATKSTHPQTNWLYRITFDDLAKNNWTQVYGIVQQSGPGDYCTKDITVPADYVGKKAILSIVGSGIDGVLYQVSQQISYIDNDVYKRIIPELRKNHNKYKPESKKKHLQPPLTQLHSHLVLRRQLRRRHHRHSLSLCQRLQHNRIVHERRQAKQPSQQQHGRR